MSPKAATFTLCFLLVAGNAVSAPPPDQTWRLICDKTLGFCARFPGTPRMETNSYSVKTKAGSGTMRRWAYRLVNDSAVFTVDIGKPPAGYVASDNEAAFLVAVENGMKKGRLVKSFSSSEETIAGYRGRAFEYEHREAAGIFRSCVKLFMADHRIVTLAITTPISAERTSPQHFFFRSFSLR